MKKSLMLIAILTALATTACIGSKLYFSDNERYNIKIAMINIDKNYEIIKSYVKGKGADSKKAINAANEIEGQIETLIQNKPSKNATVYLEHLKEVKSILNFVKEGAESNSVERTKYHFKRLRNACMSCHVRYRVGINL